MPGSSDDEGEPAAGHAQSSLGSQTARAAPKVGTRLREQPWGRGKCGGPVVLFVQFQGYPQGFALEFEDNLYHIAATEGTGLVVAAYDDGGD